MSESSKLNLLVSYVYCTQEIIDFVEKYKDDIRFLLDSGAFTAWRAKKTITVDDYCGFLDKLTITPWKYFSLDVIGDPKKTMDNYQEMLKRGYKPMPVFTRGDNLDALEEYYKTSDVVAIGGLVGTRHNRGYVKWLMNNGVKGRKVHWLGFTNLPFIKCFKPFSCDSSSLTMGNKYARMAVFDEKRGVLIGLAKTDMKNRPSAYLRGLLETYDVDSVKMRDNECYKGLVSVATRLSFRSYVRLMLNVEKKCGTYFFLAPIGVCESYAPILMDEYKKEMKQSCQPIFQPRVT